MSEKSPVEIEHDPGFIAVITASVEQLWAEGPRYRIGLLLLTAVLLAVMITFVMTVVVVVLAL